MKYASHDVTIQGDTSTNKLVIVTADGRRIALTFANRRALNVDVVMDDRPKGSFLRPRELVRWLVQNLYTPEQVEMDLKQENPQ